MRFVKRSLVAGLAGLVCCALPPPAGAKPGAAAPARAVPPAASSRGEADRTALVEAERAFARAAEENGVREAYLAFLADDAVLFRPGPVAAKEWTRSHPAPPILLSWRPSFAEVSASGDLGYTLGPYEVRPKGGSSPGAPPGGSNPGAPPVASSPGAPTAPSATTMGPAPEVEYGHFVTVWRKQADGAWRVVFDAGTENPPPPGAAASGSVVEHGKIAGGGAAEVDLEAARSALLEADRAFARTSLAKGTRAAYLAYLADDARILRDGLMPIAGRVAIRQAFSSSQRPELLVWEPARAQVSRAGDLGYTYGSSGVKEDGPKGMISDPGHYLRIWEKAPGGSWKVVLDLLKPMPPPAPPRQPLTPGTAPP
jgi:ketosteroid isomerase-like protein